jgi:DnaJ homolog subfamily B member 5
VHFTDTIEHTHTHIPLTGILQRFTPEGELQDDTKELTLTVKPGWKRGTKITFPNEGDEAVGTIPADVVFTVAEVPHPHFQREGPLLVYTARLSLADALTDCVLEVPTLDGRVLSLPCPEVSHSLTYIYIYIYIYI